MGSRADGYSMDRRTFLQALGLGSGLAALGGARWTPEAQAAVASGDVQFLPAIIHCHSCYSDGVLTPRELADEASKRGARILVITDHAEDIPLTEDVFRAKNGVAGDWVAMVRRRRGGETDGEADGETDGEANGKASGFGKLAAECAEATEQSGVLVVPGIEVDLGVGCDPYIDANGTNRLVHLLGIGYLDEDTYNKLMRRVILGATSSSECDGRRYTAAKALHSYMQSAVPGLPDLPDKANPWDWDVSQLCWLRPTKDIPLEDGQAHAASAMESEGLATVVAHPWMRFGVGKFRVGDLYTFYRERAEHIHAVEFFNGRDEDSHCLQALNLLAQSDDDPYRHDASLPSDYHCRFAVTAGGDYHYSGPWGGALDRVTWLGMRYARDVDFSKKDYQQACMAVAEAIRSRLTVAGIGDAGSMTCAEWLAKTCGGWAEEFGDTFGAQPAGSARTSALQFYARGGARGSKLTEAGPYIAHAWGKCVVAGMSPRLGVDKQEAAKPRKASGVIIVIDRSGSVSSCRQEMEQGATTVADLALEATGLVAVVNFAAEGKGAVDAALTADRDAVVSAILAPSITDGGTALYDAIIGAVNHAERVGVRAALAVLTDGQENSSSAGLSDAIREAARRDFPIVMCGYGNREDAVLTALSLQTGGACFLYGVHGDIKAFFEEFVEFSASAERVHRLTGGDVSP
ncbi:MAG: VWA domain-containing protein [Armatimonadetes bacterium]|jgi:hypothetical protein|nr:VWA domain-containing protein [Armatimonadota bacterium]